MVRNKFKSVRTLQLILSFLIIHSQLLIATVRYVSHEGSNTPPYTTWETAADSIMFAINISEFGDTIYVANGIYEEQVVMIPGLSLIGSGMDSCIIAQPSHIQFYCVVMNDNCNINGFKLNPAYTHSVGVFVHGASDSIAIQNMKIPDCRFGINFDASSGLIENCILTNIEYKAILNDLSECESNSSISNLFIINNFIQTRYDGIELSFSDTVTIISNFILVSGGRIGITTDCVSLQVKVFNNLILSNEWSPLHGLDLCNGFQAINNFIFNDFQSYSARLRSGVNSSWFINNVIMNGGTALNQNNDSLIVKYNNFWNNNLNIPPGYILDSTNLYIDPMIVNEDSTQGELDFHLQMFSPLINAGDPDIFDIDGSRSDIGLYGGPFGERYAYVDLAPKPPRNLSAVVDSDYITLTWNRNTEADFSYYNLFRDTTANFTADSTTFVLSLSDTFYSHLIPDGIDAFYYKLIATDNQGNESGPSEELAVIITSVYDYPVTVSNYQLYQNYPNPFNPSTKIGYKLKERGYVKLYVYDIKGELVSTLVNQFQEAGYYEVEFSGEKQEARGKSFAEKLASGIYIYQIMIKSENNIPVFSDMKKMILLK